MGQKLIEVGSGEAENVEPAGTDNIKSSHCEGKESPGAVAEGVISRTTADLLPDA